MTFSRGQVRGRSASRGRSVDNGGVRARSRSRGPSQVRNILLTHLFGIEIKQTWLTVWFGTVDGVLLGRAAQQIAIPRTCCQGTRSWGWKRSSRWRSAQPQQVKIYYYFIKFIFIKTKLSFNVKILFIKPVEFTCTLLMPISIWSVWSTRVASVMITSKYAHMTTNQLYRNSRGWFFIALCNGVNSADQWGGIWTRNGNTIVSKVNLRPEPAGTSPQKIYNQPIWEAGPGFKEKIQTSCLDHFWPWQADGLQPGLRSFWNWHSGTNRNVDVNLKKMVEIQNCPGQWEVSTPSASSLKLKYCSRSSSLSLAN